MTATRDLKLRLRPAGLAAVLALALAAFALPAERARAEDPAPSLSAEDAETVDALSAFLNSISTMTGTFLQIDPDGIIREGSFFLRRPGRMRFQYEKPTAYDVVSDGVWVAVLEDGDPSTERTPLRTTPLFYLLKKDVDLRGEGVVGSIERAEGQIRARAVDPDDEADGEVVMVFGDNPLSLKQWIVKDPQGLTTTIVLRTAQTNVAIEPALFVIPNPEEDEE